MINQDILEQYKNIDWQNLLRKDMGKYSLEDSKPHLDRIKSVFDDVFDYADIGNLSYNFTHQLENQLQDFIHFSNQIINEFKDTSQRQTWIDNIKNKEYEVFQTLSPIYNYIKTFDPSKDTKTKELTKHYEERVKKLNSNLTKTEKLLNEAQKKATEGEILEYGNFFGKEAGKNNNRAKTSIIWMLISIVITFILSILFIQNIEFITTEGTNFFSNLLTTINSQNILLKIVILSLSSYLITHFSKVYSAEKHLYNLNTQRQNALNSHKQILDSIISTESENEKEIRNAILLELTRSIFENKETGYLKGGGDKNSVNISPNLKI